MTPPAGWPGWRCRLWFSTTQAGISEANANWAMAAYPPGDMAWRLLTATTTWWRRHLAQLGIGINMLASTVMIVISAVGSLGPLTPQSDPLRRLRGWDQLARDLTPVLTAHRPTDHCRSSGACRPTSLAFHNQPVTIMLFDQDGIPRNHFEANHSWISRPFAFWRQQANPAIDWQHNLAKQSGKKRCQN